MQDKISLSLRKGNNMDLEQRGGGVWEQSKESMASATLALFSSSFTPTATISLKHKSSAPKTTLSFSNVGFLSSHPLALSSKRSFAPLPKSSESETAVIEVESSEPNSEALQVLQDTPPQVPKREEIFAVVMVRT